MKDLRDTFASQLLSAGVQLGYVSTQLGHADFGVTVRHYAKCVGGDEYRPALIIEPGEVPAHLLARLAESHRSRKDANGPAEPFDDADLTGAREDNWFDDAADYADSAGLAAGTRFDLGENRVLLPWSWAA